MSMPSEYMDPYVYPGTNVLKNRAEIRELELLARFEMDMTTRRAVELMARPPQQGRFDIPHLQTIHRYIFQDVYDWAGEIRTVNIARPGQFFFAFVEQIRPMLNQLFQALKSEKFLKGLNAGQFSKRAGHYMGELNANHPFRDGNGRTQREFIRQLASHNGYAAHWSRITREDMGAASKLSFQKADSSGLAALILTSITN